MASSVPHRLRGGERERPVDSNGRRSVSAAASESNGNGTQSRGADAAAQGQGTAEQPQQPKRRSGFFDSLWSLDISYERGRGRD